MTKPIAISCRDAAKALGVSKTQFWRLCATKQIRKLSHRTVAVSELEKYAQRKTI